MTTYDDVSGAVVEESKQSCTYPRPANACKQRDPTRSIGKVVSSSPGPSFQPNHIGIDIAQTVEGPGRVVGQCVHQFDLGLFTVPVLQSLSYRVCCAAMSSSCVGE